MGLAASGAKALYKMKDLFAALKRCATQKLHQVHAVVKSHPSTGSGQAPSTGSGQVFSQRKREIGHPVFVPVFVVVLCCFASLQAQNSTPGQAAASPVSKADIIFIHANVYTGVPANAQFSSILREEAIAVRGERIQAVGKNVDIQKLKGPQTQVIDLGGHFVMPGFNDAHLHLADAGLQKLNVDLTGVKTLDEFRARVLAKVETAKPGDWILGGG
jgi:hypothetical protein